MRTINDEQSIIFSVRSSSSIVHGSLFIVLRSLGYLLICRE